MAKKSESTNEPAKDLEKTFEPAPPEAPPAPEPTAREVFEGPWVRAYNHHPREGEPGGYVWATASVSSGRSGQPEIVDDGDSVPRLARAVAVLTSAPGYIALHQDAEWYPTDDGGWRCPRRSSAQNAGFDAATMPAGAWVSIVKSRY